MEVADGGDIGDGHARDVSSGGDEAPLVDAQTVFDSSASCDGSCCATCETPAGTIEQVTSQQQAYGMIEGRWLICADSGDAGLSAFIMAGAPSDTVGLEFGPATIVDASCGATGTVGCGGGNLYYLVNGPNGPVRGTGFAYQGTYNIDTGEDAFQLNLHDAPNEGYPTHIIYSPCPTELELEFLGTLVPIP